MKLGNMLTMVLLSLILAATSFAGSVEDATVGNHALHKKNYNTAIKYFTKAINANDMDSTSMALILALRGSAYSFKKDDAKAIADYNQSISINSGDPMTIINRGNAFLKLNRLDEALADYNRGLAIKPASWDGLMGRGIIYHKKKQHALAIEDLNRAININSNCGRCNYFRGKSYQAIGMPTLADADAAKAK